MLKKVFGNLRVVRQTALIVAVLVAVRALLWRLGIEGISSTAVTSGIITAGVFVVGLVVAGTLADYREAERAPVDLAAGLYAILRESEDVHKVWRKPNLAQLRRRLIAIVVTLRADIDAGASRTCLAAIEELSESFREMDDTDVPANTVVRLRSEQAGLRKTLLRIYHLQREEFLPSAYAMIVAFVGFILLVLMVTNFDGLAESLVTLGFLSFFFLSLLHLLEIIGTPFKVGVERTEDDVSLFLLSEFVVQAQAAGTGEVVLDDIEERAQEVEEQMIEAENGDADPQTTAERAASALADSKS